MRVIGTAGHVDHGKSTLVKALTGIDPDRLAEEQKREMTIDLGFAWMDLPDGETVGIVDVPGHIDFIENMLAGVVGIDLVLFVIAADEGIMPQTREHLAIIDLLEVKNGIIVLTKVDTIEDPDWLRLVSDEIRKTVAGTVLSEAPIVPVSAIKGIGLDLLKTELSRLIKESPKRMDLGRARLPIDRVFSMTGFGTIVTGTLLDGSIRTGDELVILPEGLQARIRGLQSHKHKVERIEPGSRAAVNLSNVDPHKLKRGNVLTVPIIYRATQRVDISFRMLKDVTNPIRHNDLVKVFVGTQEVVGRVRLLGSDEIKPGNYGWIQLETDQPIIVYKGDKVILRRPSPGETLGGGQILIAESKSRHKRFDSSLIQQLEAYMLGDPKEIIYQLCKRTKIINKKVLQKQAGLEKNLFDRMLDELLKNHALIELPSINPMVDSYIFSQDQFQIVKLKILGSISAFHAENPSRKGYEILEIVKDSKLGSNLIDAIIEYLTCNGDLKHDDKYVWLPSHKIFVNEKMERQMESLAKKINTSPFSPPSRLELEEQLGKSFITTLIELGKLIPLTEDILFQIEAYEELITRTKRFITENGSINVAQLRDLAGTSRKYAVAFLEYLDKTGVTIREGDFRKLLTG